MTHEEAQNYYFAAVEKAYDQSMKYELEKLSNEFHNYQIMQCLSVMMTLYSYETSDLIMQGLNPALFCPQE